MVVILIKIWGVILLYHHQLYYLGQCHLRFLLVVSALKDDRLLGTSGTSINKAINYVCPLTFLDNQQTCGSIFGASPTMFNSNSTKYKICGRDEIATSIEL